MNLPKFQDSGRLMGYAHITFKDSEAVDKALKLNKSVLDGRYLDISIASGHRSNQTGKSLEDKKSSITQETKTIFVKNLPYSTESEELGDYFSVCGKIENVRMVYNNANGNFKGFAYIDFVNHTSLYAAIKKHGEQFKGRPLVVDVDQGKAKAGFKYAKAQFDSDKYNQE